MVIPYFLFVLAMGAASQFPPWGPPNPYSYPDGYYQTRGPLELLFGEAHAHKHVVHHKHHK